MLEFVEINPSGPLRAVMVWLHGLGADGHDLAPLAREMGLPGVRHLLPHAPARPVTLNGGMAMPAWYDIVSPDLERAVDVAGILASVEAVEALLRAERARWGPRVGVVLAGFSQGGVIALHTAFRHRPAPLGVAALSSYFPLAGALGEGLGPCGFPVFMGHGEADPIVPLALAEQAREQLALRGCPPEFHVYPVPHALHPDEVVHLRAWLAGVLPSPD